ncbi:MAG: HlyD family efflux transporter periplasmic adaptor subunit [Spirochaetaceae bacterium]|jgi:HlyD family secretion protein|nr:HlyD family efflux transporter periplasmic adaptor subunit [Spirochaetaceae bacterium]
MIAEKKIIQIDEVKPKTSKEIKKRKIIVFIALLVIVAGISISIWNSAKAKSITVRDYDSSILRSGQFISTTEASGTVILPKQVEIVSPREGYALDLLVEEGDQITTQDVLAVLNVPDLEDEQNDLTLRLKQAVIELESLESSYSFNTQNLERTISRLDADILEAEEDVQSMSALVELRSSRQSDYESALDVLEDLQEQKEDAMADLEESHISQDIALRKQQAVIDQLDVDLASVIEDIEECSIKSPIDGEVLSLNESLSIKSSLIEESDSLFVVADRSDVYIDFDVYEQYTSLLEVGGQMTVTIGTSTMNATITKIGKIATMDTDGLSAMISVRARPETTLTLTPGASAVASIILVVQEDVLLLPRGSWLTTGNQKYVYLIDGDRAIKTKITLGEIQGNDVEILDGLNEGDEIITGSYQNYIDQDEISLK